MSGHDDFGRWAVACWCHLVRWKADDHVEEMGRDRGQSPRDGYGTDTSDSPESCVVGL
jgi:hypothetical protein